MKKLLIFLLLTWAVGAYGADTLYVPLSLIDSVGNINGVALASGDSVAVAVISPVGDSVYALKGAYNAATIKTLDLGGTKFPNYAIRVIVASPRIGNYTYTSVGYKNGGTGWGTPKSGTFICESATRIAIGKAVADSVRDVMNDSNYVQSARVMFDSTATMSDMGAMSDSLNKNAANYDTMGGTISNAQVDDAVDVNTLTITDDTIAPEDFKDGALDSSVVNINVFGKMLKFDLSAYVENAGDIGYYILSLYDYTNGDGLDGIDADIDALGVGSTDTTSILALLQGHEELVFTPTDTVESGDTLLNVGNTATRSEMVDAIFGENDTTIIDTSKIGAWLMSNMGGSGVLDTITLNTWAAGNLYTPYGSDFDTCTVLDSPNNASYQFKTSLLAPTGTLDGQIISYSYAFGEVVSATITDYDADSGFVYVQDGFNSYPPVGTVMKVWKDKGQYWTQTEIDSTLAGIGGVWADTLKGLWNKADSLLGLLGSPNTSSPWEYADNSIGDWVLGMRTTLDSIKGYIGAPNVSAAWEDTNSVLNVLLDLTYSIMNKLGDYSGASGDDNNIKDDFSGLGDTGSGANACSIYVESSTGGVQGVNVRLQASGGGSNYYDATNSDGWAVFALDDGTYYGYAFMPNYTQSTIPETTTFTADIKDTIAVTANTISSPSNPALIRAYVHTWDVLGDSVGSAVFRVIPRTNNKAWSYISGADTVAIVPREHFAITDSAGYGYLDIFPSASIKSGVDSLKYDFVITKQGYSPWYTRNRVAPASNWWVR
jgi:hypothetical protein